MEEIITTTVTIVTRGEPCEMDDAALKAWYESHIASLFNPRYGTPEIDVKIIRSVQQESSVVKNTR